MVRIIRKNTGDGVPITSMPTTVRVVDASNSANPAIENALRHIEADLERNGRTLLPPDDELSADFWMRLLWKNHHFQNDPIEWADWQTLFEGDPEIVLSWPDWRGYGEWRGLAWEPMLELFVNNELVSELSGLWLESPDKNG